MFSAHEARLRCGMFCLCMRHGFVAARAADRYAPAAHTLTEGLLPTTCVVVNKPSALKHFPTTGAAPRLSESRSRVPRNRRSDVPLRGACLRGGGSMLGKGRHFPIFCGADQGWWIPSRPWWVSASVWPRYRRLPRSGCGSAIMNAHTGRWVASSPSSGMQ